MNSFTIKDLENLSGIKAHTLRIWEQRYKFLKPCRTCTNIRYYSNDELKKILNISLLNKNGFKISHIDKMEEQELQEKIISLTQTEAHKEKRINDLVQCMIDLNIEAFETIIDNSIAKSGIEKTIIEILFPFLEKIGILWLTNNIYPGQEHLVCNIIRQKLILGIENVAPTVKSGPSVLLFLPENEFHEIGLLFVCYLLKSKGIKVIYLGSNIPLMDVAYVVQHKKPDYIYAHLTSVSPNFDFDQFISAISRTLNKNKIVISGRLILSCQKKIPANIQFKKSFAEVLEFVASL